MKKLWLVLVLCATMNAADDAAVQAGKKAEQQSCVACHSLRLIESQRLSAAAWKKEIAKMIGWGAVVPNQEVLLDYLTTEFSDSKPVPPPEHSTGSK
jgi:mono/diheme cytochrome c family protein